MIGKWLKKFAAAAAAYLLAIVLFAASSAAVFHFVIADESSVKGILKDSGVYASLTEAFVDESAKNPGDNESTVPIKDPKIQKIAKSAFSPEVIQTNTEEFIDGTYAWLNGETEEAQFTLDFTKSKNQLAEGIGDYAQKRAANLPTCGFFDIPQNVEAFKMDCLPPGVSAKQIGTKTTQDLRTDKTLLPKTKITPETLFDNDRDNPFKQQEAPSNFQLLKNLLWIFLILAVILSAAAVLLSENKLKGIGKISKSFLAVGVLVVLMPFSLKFFSGRLIDSDLFKDELSKQVALPVAQEFIGAISTVYYVFGGICILIGMGGLFFAYKQASKQPEAQKPSKSSLP